MPTVNEIFDHLNNDGWEIITDDGFVGLVGPFVKKSDSTGLCFGFPTFHKHHNYRGFLQGGALITFADRALGITARSAAKGHGTATVQLNVQFIDVVKIGEFVETRPMVTRATKQLIFMNTTVTVGPRVIAIVQGIWKILGDSHRAGAGLSAH
jgi:acyl-coenzyme A thioesterase PaaI-like protein